jgi:hypothetical protein
MKTTYSFRIMRNMAVISIMFLSGSCLDYVVNTRVNKDGSITREYVVRGDSTEIFKGSLCVPYDSLWKVTHTYVNKDKQDTASEKSQYEYRASRTFKSGKELSEWMASDTSSRTIKTRVTVHKRFRWFYTYYEYKEVFPMSYPFRKVPVDSFLTKIEQSIVIDDGQTVYSPAERKMIWKKDTLTYRFNQDDSVEMKKISDQCEEKLVRWMTASLIEEFIGVLESDLGDNPATKEIRQKSDQFSAAVFNKVRLLSDDSISVQLLVSIGDSLITSDRLNVLYASNPGVFAAIDKNLKELDFLDNDDDYYQSLTMPGNVFSTNAEEIKTPLLIWDFEPNSFLMKDFVMSASSRIANYWILVLTGMIAAFLLVILVSKRKGR